MSRFAIYALDTGEIAAVPEMHFAPEHFDLYREAALAPFGAGNHGLLEAGDADPARHYVGTLGGEPRLLDRPVLAVALDRTAILADGEDAATLTGLPDPCTVTVDAEDPTVETSVHEVAGGGFLFAAETPGTYAVTIDRFPFLPFRVLVTAT